MPTMAKGIGLVRVCDYCGFPCEEEVITIFWQVRNGEKRLTFCCQEHLENYLGVEEKVTSGVDKQFKRECNLLYKEVCPACRRRLQKLL